MTPTETDAVELFPGFKLTGADVLADIGCGSGWASLAAARVGADVIALDVTQVVIDNLREAMKGLRPRSFTGLVSMDPRLPIADAAATAVVCTEVLEHVERPADFVAELARIGMPGARYLISVPDSVSEGILRHIAPASYWAKPNHINVFTPAQLDELIAGAGLVIERHVPTNFSAAMWWILNWTVGGIPNYHPGSKIPRPPLLAKWEEIWAALEHAPQGPAVIQELDRHIPKSRAVIARKPGAAGAADGGGGGNWEAAESAIWRVLESLPAGERPRVLYLATSQGATVPEAVEAKEWERWKGLADGEVVCDRRDEAALGRWARLAACAGWALSAISADPSQEGAFAREALGRLRAKNWDVVHLDHWRSLRPYQVPLAKWRGALVYQPRLDPGAAITDELSLLHEGALRTAQFVVAGTGQEARKLTSSALASPRVVEAVSLRTRLASWQLARQLARQT